MKITRTEFDQSISEIGLDPAHGAELWRSLERNRTAPAFTGANILVYAGALIIMSAMTLYVGSQWDAFSGMALALIGLLYGGVFLGVGRVLARRDDGRSVAGGLCVTVALAMVPMIVYGIQVELAIWPGVDPGSYGDFTRYIKGGWFAMEAVTLAAGGIMLARYRFPFLGFVIGVILWFMSMDIAPLLVETHADYFDIRRQVSVAFGAVMILAAYGVDLAFRRDFAFWLYLFGVLTFWSAVTASDGSTEFARFLYFLLNVALIAVSVFLRRRVFMVFGVLGIITYFGYLAFELFADSIWFPFALSGFGVLILMIGFVVLKFRDRLAGCGERAIPEGLQRLRPDRA